MTVVFKLGGSLMTLERLAERLQLALDQRSNEQCLVIPGGGESADIVRGWSRVHHIDEETAHSLALSSLDLNRHLIEHLLKIKSVISRTAAEALWSADSVPILLNLKEFVATEETPGSEMPH